MKKTVKLLALFLCVAMLLPLLSGQLLSTKAYGSDVAYAVEGGNLYFDKATGTITDCDESVTAVSIPEMIEGVPVVRIGLSAFSFCEELTTLTIPKSVTEIEYNPFGYCEALTSIRVDKDNPTYASDEKGNVYSKDKTILLIVPSGHSGTFVIPNHVKTIEEEAFTSCKKLTNITIPNSVTCIGGLAFHGCYGLTDIVIPDSVTTLGYAAFGFCASLKNVTLSKSLTEMEFGLFSFCESLTSVTIPDGVTTISFEVFSDCTALKSVYIPGSVTSIENSVFYGCSALKDVYYSGTEEMWNQIAIVERENDALLNAKIHFGQTPPVEEPPVENPPSNNPFVDVKESDYFAQPVLWAVEKGITNGTGAGKFSPENTCTRGQIVTFLWRAAGSPEPKTADNPFSDVAPNTYYYKAVLWAVENEITTGTGKGKFSPENTCTRGQVATFLWRAQGKPAPATTTNPFTDVEADAYYYSAVLWAVENEITNGTGKGLFSPEKDCTRGQIVTFLYRAMA